MKLTPLDIHHKEFRLALRGYNQEEVDQFLDEVADEFERLFKENIDQAEKLDVANEKVRAYAEIEKTLHNTMLAAQTSAEEIKAKAVKESDALLRDAEIKAKELVQSALSEKQRTQSEFMRIKAAEDEFRMKFRSVLEDYMRNLHEVPVAADVAALVGLAEAAPADTTSPVRPAAQDATPEAEPAVEVPLPADPDRPPFMAAAERQPDVAIRPRAHVATRPDENTQPLPLEAPTPGVARGLTLGEIEAPDLRADEPMFEEPAEFPVPRFGGFGERDDDVDIEEID